MTQTPFPRPLPRTALPPFADPTLKRALQEWNARAVGEVVRMRLERQRAQSQAVTNAILSSCRLPSYTSPVPYLGATSTGFSPGVQGPSYVNAYPDVNTYTQQAASASPSGDHATALDAATAAINLTSTIAGAVTGNAGGILGGMLFSS